jgi:hypothetical protein
MDRVPPFDALVALVVAVSVLGALVLVLMLMLGEEARLHE